MAVTADSAAVAAVVALPRKVPMAATAVTAPVVVAEGPLPKAAKAARAVLVEGAAGSIVSGGQGGLGGGAGAANGDLGNGGGGGAAFGGIVFVRAENGAFVTLNDSSFAQNGLTAGQGNGGGGNGLAAGSALFLGGGNLNLSVSSGQTQIVAGSIAQSDPSSLTKTGLGTLVLSGDNGGLLGYTGGTTVSQGTLLVNNTTGTGLGFGPVNVLPGATLGGTGSITGTVQLADGSHLSLSVGGSGSLTFGSDLTLSHNTILDYSPSLAASPVEVAGTLTLAGLLDVNAGPSLVPGTYRLFDFGTIINQGLMLTDNAPTGFAYSIAVDANDHQVDLVVTQASPARSRTFELDGHDSVRGSRTGRQTANPRLTGIVPVHSFRFRAAALFSVRHTDHGENALVR